MNKGLSPSGQLRSHETATWLVYEVNWIFQKRVQDNSWAFSNEILYDILPKRTSKLPDVKLKIYKKVDLD